MKKIVLLIVAACFSIGEYCLADEYEASLAVSSDSFQGGFNIVQDMSDGFWKTGVGVLYHEEENTEYKWLEIGITVGGNMFQPGFSCEVGMKGLLGTADAGIFSGDVGAVAFTGQVSYDFAQQMTIPGYFKTFAGVDYANDILAFQDAEEYIAFHVGLDVPIFEHASVTLVYSSRDMDMKSGPGNWTLEDDALRAGLKIQF